MEVKLFLFVIGYLFIVVICLIAALTWTGRRNYGILKTIGVVLITLFVLYAVPFGDHTLGEIKRHQLCKELGGTKIYQVVENVDGFMWERSGSQGNPPHSTYGYSFTEASDLDGRIYRYTRKSSDLIDSQMVEKSQARYVARGSPYENIGPRHLVRRFSIIDVTDSKVLAVHGLVAYRGGWLGYGSVTCPQEIFDPITFVQQVLKPRN